VLELERYSPVVQICRSGCRTNYPGRWWSLFPFKLQKEAVLKHCQLLSAWESSVVDQHHRQIIDKTCVVSARDDNLQTIKIYLSNAAQKQGMSLETKVTGLALIIAGLSCQSSNLVAALLNVSDWFHIGKDFITWNCWVQALKMRWIAQMETLAWWNSGGSGETGLT